MKERPILFSAPMVRAILDGRKTQTRRVVKPIPPKATIYINHLDGDEWSCIGNNGPNVTCPYVPGDRLWVREAWSTRLDRDHLKPCDLDPAHDSPMFWADPQTCNTGCGGAAGRKRASFHLPRWASRITLEVVNVRAERVQEITRSDCQREGSEIYSEADAIEFAKRFVEWPERKWYRELWGSLNAKRGYGWDKNSWVWVIEFKRIVA